MDEDGDLVARLLTLAGAMMEDASAVAIVVDEKSSIEDQLAAVKVAADDVRAVVAAAEVIQRHRDRT